MFCYKCGVTVPDGSKVCPNCGVSLEEEEAPQQPQQPQQPPKKNPFAGLTKRDENAGGKGYAAIASSLFVFPTLVCIAKDLLDRDGRMTWSAYAIGIAMCLWMLLVLPALKPKRPAVTACVCLCVISLYMALLAYVNSSSVLYINYVMPICLMITVSSALLSILISYKVIKDIHIASAVIGQAGLLSIGTEILFDVQRTGAVHLRWSIYAAIIAVSAIAVIEAINYANRVARRR